MGKHYRKTASGFLLLGMSFVAVTTAWAAKPIDLQTESLSSLRSLSSAITFKQISADVDFKKTTHMRIQEMYQGYPVWAADAVVHAPADAAGNVSQLLEHPAQASSLPAKITLNGTVYTDLACDLSLAPAYMFQPAQADKALQVAVAAYQKAVGNKQPITDSATELMIYIDDNNTAHWAFRVSFRSEPARGLPALPIYILDGLSFTPYAVWNNLQTERQVPRLIDVGGGGFGGNLKVGKLVYDNLPGDLPQLEIKRNAVTKMCYMQNADVTVRDYRHKNDSIKFACLAPASDHNKMYWDADQDSVNGGYSPSNDALYAGKIVKAMYQQWYNLPVLTQNGKPMILEMRVHEPVDNAFWDGKQMRFGDGVNDFYPLVSIGVAAHEISHGFTQQHSNLFYYGQPGGLDESFSDMAAQAAEFYTTGHNSWQIGAEIMKAKNQALRYMDDPTRDGISIDTAKNYSPMLDVHRTSGVFNKLFYVLATSPGWNTKKAFDVMVQANSHYWTSNSNFKTAACGVLKAALDYSYDTSAVVHAATGVGIDVRTC